MDKQISDKLDALAKYVPFIDYMLELDKQKYIKFVDIRKWIIQKKRYPLSDLNKIEQSIITQYKNLIVLEDKKMSPEIMEIFSNEFKPQFIDLCSDDEDNDVNAESSNSSTKKVDNHKILQDHNESDDDLEFVSISYQAPPKEELTIVPKEQINDENTIDKSVSDTTSVESSIDEDNIVCAEPPASNHLEHSAKDCDEILFYRRTPNVFKRSNVFDGRNDSKPNEHSGMETLEDPTSNTIQEDMDIETDVDEIVDNSSNQLEKTVDDSEVLTKTESTSTIVSHPSTKDNGAAASEETEKLLKKVSSIDLRNLENFNLEELLSCIIQVDETKNAHLESLFLKTVLRRLRNSTPAEQSKPNDSASSSKQCVYAENLPLPSPPVVSPQPWGSPQQNHQPNEYTNPTLAQPTLTPPIYQHPLGYPQTSVLPSGYNESLCSQIQAMTRQHKLNLNDPRVRNFLNKLKSSPVLTTAERNMAVNLSNFVSPVPPNSCPPFIPPQIVHCPPLHHQPSIPPPVIQHGYNITTNVSPPVVPASRMPVRPPQTCGTTRMQSQSITYAEYKRRKAEELLRTKKQMEYEKHLKENERRRQENETRRQEEERKRLEDEIKRKKELEDIGKRDEQKKTDEIRNILLNTLKPHEGQIASMWEKRKKSNDNDSTSNDVKTCDGPSSTHRKSIENLVDAHVQKEHNKINDKKVIWTKKDISSEAHKNQKDKPKSSKNDTKEKNKIDRVNRAIKELQCTFKGFDQLQDFIPKTVGGKRRSSVHARSAIAEQLTTLDDTDVSLSQSTNNSSSSQNKSTRRKTIDMGENADILYSQSSNESSQSYTCSSISHEAKRRRISMSEESKRKSSVNAQSAFGKQLSDQSYNDIDISTTQRSCTPHRRRTIEEILQNQPSVVLVRLTEDEIIQHTKRPEKHNEHNKNSEQNLNVYLIESKSQPISTTTITASKSSTKELPKPLNNDCEMTERNTKHCCLCKSKPSDLTNHYLRKHKCESYVSRLTWSQLDELCINTPFAKVVPSTHSRVARCSIICPFCDEELKMPFMSLYDHYSIHTGEYAFQCASCLLEKPFKADIQSHQLHSKTCRSSRIQTIYLYPVNTMVIYLYYCSICNFVQLNEANIKKHLREHHDQRQVDPNKVKKCILAAITGGPPVDNETYEDIEKKIPVNNNMVTNELCMSSDNDIPVRNEPCSEDLMDSGMCATAFETQLVIKPPVPMVELHVNSSNDNGSKTTCPSFARKHVPKVLKIEPTDVEEPENVSGLNRPLKKLSSNTKSTPRSKYRLIPSTPHVNYFGLYKCMAEDCYYSTDSSEEMLKHYKDYIHKTTSDNNLQCPYCIIKAKKLSPEQLVEHIEEKHQHMIYQCSVCYYRSCEASNVLVHQLENHEYNEYQIYKCDGIEQKSDERYLQRKLGENVKKLQCSHCRLKCFYHSKYLEQHINEEHQLTVPGGIKYYSCIYCPMRHKSGRFIRVHVALNHPEEWPHIFDHNESISISEDSIQNLKPSNWSNPTSVKEINTKCNYVSTKQPKDVDGVADEELLRRQEDVVRQRLCKLLEKTGVVPDNLYKCPEHRCGSIFSVFGLWLHHMRAKHYCTECRCPHCPSTRVLEDYKTHFEQHRRHLYICFHCPQTFGNYQDIELHASREHSALGVMRLEKIRYNISFNYFVRIQAELLTKRLDFLKGLLSILNTRLLQHLKHSWLVPSDSSKWLDDYPKDIGRKLKKRCFNGNCDFRSTETDELFKHVRENHNITGSTFNCSQCDFSLPNCTKWDEVLDHIGQHSDNSLFICALCFNYHYTRSKLAAHIREKHAMNDVPIINLIKKRSQIHLRLSVVFANECLYFSTMRNCFCCKQCDMDGKEFVKHLERHHKLVLNFFCEWCNLPIASQHVAVEHFQKVHTRNKLKIRCEFASQYELSVVSVRNLQVRIFSSKDDERTSNGSLVAANSEHSNNVNNVDSIIVLEDDIANNAENATSTEAPAMYSKMGNTSSDNIMPPQQRPGFPRIKVVPKRKLQASVIPNDVIRNSNTSFPSVTLATPPAETTGPTLINSVIPSSIIISNNQHETIINPLIKTPIQCISNHISIIPSTNSQNPTASQNEYNKQQFTTLTSPTEDVIVPKTEEKLYVNQPRNFHILEPN